MDSTIYLCAPVNALVEGIFEQNVPLAELKQHGDFGLGTFNDLDGELVLLDGTVYQVAGDGQVVVVEDEKTLTPFACVTRYCPISHDELDRELAYDDFLDWLVRLLPSPNLFYALRIEGEFAVSAMLAVFQRSPTVAVAAASFSGSGVSVVWSMRLSRVTSSRADLGWV